MARRPGHKRGCRCVGCSPATRKRGLKALRKAAKNPRRKKRAANPRRRAARHSFEYDATWTIGVYRRTAGHDVAGREYMGETYPLWDVVAGDTIVGSYSSWQDALDTLVEEIRNA